MKFYLTVFIILNFNLIPYSKADESQNSILVLTDSNFNDAIKSNKYLLVHFHTTGCKFSKRFEPEFLKTVAELNIKKPEVKFGTLDVDKETAISKEFEDYLENFPTVIFFVESQIYQLQDVASADRIVKWVIRKLRPPVSLSRTYQDLEELIDLYQIVALGLFKKESRELKKFISVANDLKQTTECAFVVSKTPELFEHFQIDQEDAIILFTNFDEGRYEYSGNFDPNDIIEFILTKQIALVSEINEDNLKKMMAVLNYIKGFMFLFVDKKSEDYDKLHTELKEIANNYKSSLKIFIGTLSDPFSKQYSFMFGIQKSDLPAVRILKFGEKTNFFKLDSLDVDKNSIETFIQQFLKNKLEPYEPIFNFDSYNSNSDLILTLDNYDFNDVLGDTSVNLLIHFYQESFDSNEEMIYETLAKNYQHKEDLVIAKIDMSNVKLENVQVQTFPTIRFYAKGEARKMYEFTGNKDLRDLTSFVEDCLKSENKDEL